MQASHKWMTLCALGIKKSSLGILRLAKVQPLIVNLSLQPWNFTFSTSIDFLGKLSIFFFSRLRILIEQQHFPGSSACRGWVSPGWQEALSPQLDSPPSPTADFLWLMMADGLWWLLFPVLLDVITFYQSQLVVGILKPTCCQLMVNPPGASSAWPAAPIQWLCHTGVNSC